MPEDMREQTISQFNRDIELITASEAKRIASANLGNKARSLLNKINNDIQSAVSRNKFSIRINETLSEDDGSFVRKKLQEAGYTIRDVAGTSYGRDDDISHIIISW